MRNIMDAKSLRSVYVVLVRMLLCPTIFGLFIDYNDNSELVQQRAGNDIRLQCGLQGLVDEKDVADIKIHWYFKQCREESTSPGNCHDWIQLPCEENFCKPDLLLRNVTAEYSGLYKCTVHPQQFKTGHTLDIQLVRTYQLEVKNWTMTVPQFVDSYPLNKSVTEGAQVVFQCRVHSEEHPTIKWFRRVPAPTIVGTEYTHGVDNFSSHIVNYNGRTYELLRTAREKLIGDQTYMSKLILNGVRLHERGYYACVAISYRGHKTREAFLEVHARDDVDYWADYDATEEGYTDPREFWLLFLMPLGLAMLPATVLVCYVMYKKCLTSANAKRKEQAFTNDDIDGDHCMLRA